MLKHAFLTILVMALWISAHGQEALPVAEAETPVAASGVALPAQSLLIESDRNVVAESGFDDSVHSQPEEMDVLTLKLQVPVPDDLIYNIVSPVLGPNSQIEYDDELRLLVMRAPKDRLPEAVELVNRLCEPYREAFERELKDSQPQPVRIEAVLLIGHKDPHRIVSATETTLSYPLPAEIAHLGLGPEDLLPFAFGGGVEVVGRAVLHTDLPPFRFKPSTVTTDLAGHRLEFALSHRSEPFNYPVLEVTASYSSEAAHIADYGGEGKEPQRVAMKSEPKAVFDRPILVGSYKPNKDQTAIVAIRLTKVEE